jgi:PDZ domain-containing protein
VRSVYHQVRSEGHVHHHQIGVSARNMTLALASGLGLEREDGILVEDVIPGGPAASSGLMPGDIVLSVNELHVAKQQTDEERFWAEGFEMIRREDFHPVWAIEEIRSTRPDVVIVHADISYSGGIPLKGGDYIPAFSEIHTFIVSRDKAGWRIAGHDITKRALQ